MPDEPTETAAPESSAQEQRPETSATIVYCSRCGGVMGASDRFCHVCGWEVGASEAPRMPAPVVNPSDRNRLTALLLCIFLGWVGAHRFYVGKVGTGLIWLFTFAFLGVGVIYDLIFLATGEFRDDRERRLVRWD